MRLGELNKAFRNRNFPIDRAVADEWGHISGTLPLPVIDALLAATVKVNGMTPVTRDVIDVSNLDVLVPNPFAA
jgi:predicted nucleic acid-binding protein